MRVLIIDKKTKKYYGVNCASNDKGFLNNVYDFGTPDENDFSFWTEDIKKAFDFGSEQSAQNDMNMNDMTCDGTCDPIIKTYN